MDLKKTAMVAAGVVGVGAIALSLAVLAVGALGIPVAGSSYGSCCCCCSYGYFVPILGLVGVAIGAKTL